MDLSLNLRQTISTNIDLKLEYYTQQQTYQHMFVINSSSLHPIKMQEAELVKYLKLMVAKVLLHIRTGQTGHVYDIFVSLFDIVNDTSILGINKTALSTQRLYKWKKPDLFGFREDHILQWLKQGIFDELQMRQMLFWLVQSSYLCVKNDKTSQWLDTMLRFWYKFIRDSEQLLAEDEMLKDIQAPWIFACL